MNSHKHPSPLAAAAAQLRLAGECLTTPVLASFPKVVQHLASSAEALREVHRREKAGERGPAKGLDEFRRELGITRKLLESAGGLWAGLAEIHWPRAGAYDRQGNPSPTPDMLNTTVKG